ncbi:tetratricopeptide repeat-containing sensor histidine kinase [Roseivirga pacifica]|uniref:tetratricopeptide repeat-containing sensor histidine kinase n=1 Tax=Roseivirga pacifica TaxID=1267423 RepID=UPI002095D7E0|nr:tetratricopeptide repeat-containing sensor histidine kinase [Roseivirga pacifica]MCO6360473.1 tetratricopeptide repeat protein [Roseivirga pacifica]MCO6368362.1 tetratricopeptide repeat protein [Roseivirga pacifica]MCO6372504.1 tetratricopeptide repeat protein [Roseivirga pacifica]MCO6376562.1 tetratricopeptide repeat protein [Roseivirga pacifica]MCO6378158.1 tetratricopeptide repeat protein [Roseivirga pacifica]
MPLAKHLRFLIAATFLLFSGFHSLAQNITQADIDALKDSLALKSGKERIEFLGDLGFKYRTINTDSAWHYARQAYAEAEEFGDDDLQGRISMNLAILKTEAGDYVDAIKSYKLAMNLVDSTNGSQTLSFVYHNMANAFERTGEIDSAIYYSLRALRRYEIANDSQRIANVKLNIASQYRTIKEYELSEKVNMESLEMYRALNNVFFQAAIENNLALLNNDQERYEKALSHAQESLKLWQSIGQRLVVAYSYTNLGIAQKGLGNLNEAEESLKNALALQQERGDKYEVIFLKMHLADVLNRRGNYAEAASLGVEAYQGAVNDDILTFQQKTALTLSKIYENQRNYKDALTYMQKSTAAQDSLFLTEKAKEVLKLKEQYETEQKENEILRQRNELIESELTLKRRNNLLIAGGGLLVVLLVVGISLIRVQRLKAERIKNEAALERALAEAKAQENLKEQRIRIARDLHDNIGSQLTYITSITDTTRKGIDRGEVFLAEKLMQMKQFTLVTISELRDTIWAMNKDEISLEDIQERTQQLAATIHDATDDNIRVRTESEPSDKVLNAFVGMNLFRIIQECINNAVKHSETREVLVSFKDINNKIEIVVQDFGKGFDTEVQGSGNGLYIMKNRAEKAGIDFNLTSLVGGGTKVELRV